MEENKVDSCKSCEELKMEIKEKDEKIMELETLVATAKDAFDEIVDSATKALRDF